MTCDESKDLEWQLRLAEAVWAAREPINRQWPTPRGDAFMVQLEAYVEDLRAQLSGTGQLDTSRPSGGFTRPMS